MRPLEQWDESDLDALVDSGVQESLTLDYKWSASLSKTDNNKKNEISKDVAAFANSAGGRIIYGIKEADQLPQAVDDGSDGTDITREWLEQIINSLIKPRIDGIIIKPILLKSQGWAFVVDIPQSQYFAPHQSSDKKYYKRYNFSSVPMEDYEIRDVMRRSARGHPYVVFHLRTAEQIGQITEFIIDVSIGNRSDEPVLYSTIMILIDKLLVIDGETLPEMSITELAPKEINGRATTLVCFAQNWSVPAKMPLYKERAYAMGTMKLRASQSGLYVLGYTISCPGYSGNSVGTFTIHNGQIASHNPELRIFSTDVI